MRIKVTCTYCGYIDLREVYSKDSFYRMCMKCKDENVKAEEWEEVDYYKGSPPFPPKPFEGG